MCRYARSLLPFPTLCDAMDAPLSTGFSRQEYQSELPCLPPGDLPDPGIKAAFPASPAWQADSLPLSHPPFAQNSHKEALNPLVPFYSNSTAQRIPDFHGHPPGTEDPTDPESPSPCGLRFRRSFPVLGLKPDLVQLTGIKYVYFFHMTLFKYLISTQVLSIDLCPSSFHAFNDIDPPMRAVAKVTQNLQVFFCSSVDFSCLLLELKWTLTLLPSLLLARGSLSPYVHLHVVSMSSLNTHIFSPSSIGNSVSS